MPIHREINQSFFKKWTSDMAYILGFIYADGNIVESKRGTHFIAIYTADKPLLYGMRRSMQSAHKISERRSISGVVYRIQIGSKEICADLGKLGLTPRKSKRMTLPNIPDAYAGDFIRGYFDGDGNIWLGLLHRKRPTSTTGLILGFTSASFEFLASLLKKVRQFGIRGGSIRISKQGNYTRLTFSTLDALKIYEIMYNAPHKLYLSRKKLVFDRYKEKKRLAPVV